MRYYNDDLPDEYRCVRTRPWDQTAWVYFIIRELRVEGLIESEDFVNFTIFLELPLDKDV